MWTGYRGLKTWVPETDVTPKAVAAFLKHIKKLSAAEFAAHWEGVLILAAKKGDIYKVRSLPDLKRFANCKDHLNNTPLHYAVANYHNIKMLKLLLDRNADINAQNNRGKTALHWAATSTRPRTVLALLRAGADVDPQDLDQETPLHKAARFNRVDAAKALIVHGADVHARDKDGDTPVADAKSKGYPKMESLLRQHGGH
jgi:ankyrin repeat protein